MTQLSSQKPGENEYAEFYRGYVSLVGDGPITDILIRQIHETANVLKGVPKEMSSFRYSEEKWSVAEVLGHLIDTERVMAYRALSFARGDRREIAGMDQDRYASNSCYDECEFAELIEEFEALRRANILFFEHLSEDSWDREGIASGHPVTVRALAYIIAGHELHHMNVLEERYLGKVGRISSQNG